MQRDLAGVQAFLAETLRRGAPVTGEPEVAKVSAIHVAGNDRLSPAEQVDIYREQYWLRHEAALFEDFPGLERVIGHAEAHAFFQSYLVAHPPKTPSLRDLGAHVPSFAASYEGIPDKRRDLALDMARYEHALVDLFDGPDAPGLDPQKLTGLDADAWEKARIVLHPVVVLASFSYPVHRLRRAIQEGGEVVLPEAPEPVSLVLYRRDAITKFEELEPEAWSLLGLLREGVPLVPALDRISRALPEDRRAFVAESVGAWFQRWTAWGILVDVVP